MVGPRNDPMESSKNVLEFPLTLALLEAWSLGFDKGLLKKKCNFFKNHLNYVQNYVMKCLMSKIKFPKILLAI